ncbi:MAG: uncharacterized protein JWM21_3916 [Acidobacteria bacterium]|nr:uncharacterized protein [Acidobacteriota bacterium]
MASHKLKCVFILIALGISTRVHAQRQPGNRGSKAAAELACLTNKNEEKLFAAIKLKDSASVQDLLASGVNPNARAEINFEGWEPHMVTCATALMIAARVGDARTAQLLLAAKADVNARDNVGRYIWEYAVGYYTMLQLVSALQSEDEKVQSTVASARLQAEMDARLQLAKVLLASGVDLETSGMDNGGQTPMYHSVDAAILTGDVRILKLLIAAGAHVNMKNDSILAYATMTGQMVQGKLKEGTTSNLRATEAEVIDLLLKAGANVNSNRNGFTPLMMAAGGSRLEGSMRRLKVLLAAGADVNAQYDTSTALLYALKPFQGSWRDPLGAFRDQIEAVKLLLAAGADPNKGSALHVALDTYSGYSLFRFPSEREALFQALMAAGADPSARDDQGRTVLMHALEDLFRDGGNGVYAEEDKLHLLKSLIAGGADVNMRDKQGKTALNEAILNRSDEVVRTLIAAGANLTVPDKDGASPMHLAAAGGRRAAVVRLLIKSGANINVRDKEGRTPLMVAIAPGTWTYGDQEKNCREMVDLLLHASATVDVRSHNSDTPLIIAARRYGSDGDRWRRESEPDEFILTELIAAGAKVKEVNEDGESALSIIAAKSGPGSLPIINRLIASAQHDDSHWRPPVAVLLAAIRRAAGHSAPNVVHALVAAGADVNGVDEAGRSVLISAITESGNLDVVSALLKAGTRVNAKDINGDTALIAAVREYQPGENDFIKNALRRDLEVIRALLVAGADTGATGKDGQNALALAEKSSNQKLIDLIRQKAQP